MPGKEHAAGSSAHSHPVVGQGFRVSSETERSAFEQKLGDADILADQGPATGA
jgi:hypothetical protein